MFLSNRTRLMIVVVGLSLILTGIVISPTASGESVHHNQEHRGNSWAYLPIIVRPYLFTITRASVASDGTEGNNGSATSAISADGRYVAFVSLADNLVANDTFYQEDVFVHDLQTRQTSLISVASNGIQSNGQSLATAISSDGRYVAFASRGANLFPGDFNDDTDVFVRDQQDGETHHVSVATNGTQGNGHSGNPSISADGRYVAFSSLANNLVTGDTNDYGDVFVHDLQTGQTSRVSVSSDGIEGNGHSRLPTISADGRYVVFGSTAGTLVAGDTNFQEDVFVHDRQTGQTTRVSVASDGTQANNGSRLYTISANGRYVAFLSNATNLVSGDTNHKDDIFVHDRQTGQTTRVSVASDGTQGNGSADHPSISSDGRYVVFSSSATNLVYGDTNDKPDIFLHDRQTGQTILISMNSSGIQSNDYSWDTSISADGRTIAFTSVATNLVSGDTNNYRDVFVHDRGELELE